MRKTMLIVLCLMLSLTLFGRIGETFQECMNRYGPNPQLSPNGPIMYQLWYGVSFKDLPERNMQYGVCFQYI